MNTDKEIEKQLRQVKYQFFRRDSLGRKSTSWSLVNDTEAQIKQGKALNTS